MRNMQHRWIELPALHLFGADGDEDESDDSQEDADNDETSESTEDKYSQDYVDKLRKEAADRRIKGKEAAEELATAKAKLAEIEKAQMSDLDAAKKEAEEAQARAEEAEKVALQSSSQLKTERIQNAVTMAAMEAGFEDPTDALSMISQDDLVDDEGNIASKAVKAQLKKLADKKPYLLKKHRPGSSDGGGKDIPDNPDDFEGKTKAHLKTMTETGGRIVI